ncbi:CoA-transferase family III domain-containing protein [Polychytrium aggregatum]|uniref:CoA-transferase family III domain-containing protein n=1 Tax=Polychytrium aggregatum TaxID=110093 RepID=UPI0022FE730E|nr:CoA-transferase family III domain-containing protein [Polychytrium aggregatum]KAI9208188.1 CoA-transferase family III domain-containing protein [Polychytrium aggregatum]
MILGDMGAEVIKVENPKTGGDDTRSWGPPFAPNIDPSDPNPPESAYFLGINRNKKSITVNFKHPEGVDIIKKLAANSDILIENHIPGKLEKLGLGYEELKTQNPGLIYASITGYGPDGPFAHHAGYDVIIEAEAGLMYITGEPDGPPVKVGVAITDMTTGLYAHGAILAALIARGRTGQGQKLDVSLLECQVASLANIGHSYLIGGQEAKRWGTSHAAIVPYQAFPTKDSFVVIGAGNDGQFEKLCQAIDQPELLQDPRFQTNKDRVAHRKELIEILSDVFSTHPTKHWLGLLEPIGVPFAPVNNIAETFQHPQVIHRGMVQKIKHPRAGDISLIGPPVKYSNTPPSVRMPPPVLGEHTHVVLRDVLGYSDQDIDDLARRGVV